MGHWASVFCSPSLQGIPTHSSLPAKRFSHEIMFYGRGARRLRHTSFFCKGKLYFSSCLNSGGCAPEAPIKLSKLKRENPSTDSWSLGPGHRCSKIRVWRRTVETVGGTGEIELEPVLAATGFDARVCRSKFPTELVAESGRFGTRPFRIAQVS